MVWKKKFAIHKSSKYKITFELLQTNKHEPNMLVASYVNLQQQQQQHMSQAPATPRTLHARENSGTFFKTLLSFSKKTKRTKAELPSYVSNLLQNFYAFLKFYKAQTKKIEVLKKNDDVMITAYTDLGEVINSFVKEGKASSDYSTVTNFFLNFFFRWKCEAVCSAVKNIGEFAHATFKCEGVLF